MMRLLKTAKGVVLNVYVKTDSREFNVKIEDDELVIYCKEPPVKGKVNRELTKELSKVFKRRVEIVAGFTSKQKRVLINDSSPEEVNDLISKCRR